MNESSVNKHPSFFTSHRFAFAHLGSLPTLTANRLLAFAASSIIGMFFPIFLYEFFHQSIHAVLLFYLIDQSFRLPFVVLGAKLFSRIGLTKSMIIGTFGLAGFYLAYFLLSEVQVAHPFLLIGLGICGSMITSVLYWSPFHIDFALFSTKSKRGEQVGKYFAVQRLISVLGPLIAGYLIATHGYHMTFFLGLFLVIFSIFPLFYLPKELVVFEFGYWQTFRELFSKRFRHMAISMAAFGAESIVGAVVWPIFLYMIFRGDYLNIGVFAAVITVVTIFLQLFVGKETDKISAKKMLRIGTGVYALGWIWKGLVQTISGVFAASTFHSIGAILLQTPMDTLNYQQAADAGHYIDEYTVLREMALNIGRIFMFIILIVLNMYFSISVSFFIAALISLGINQLSNKK